VSGFSRLTLPLSQDQRKEYRIPPATRGRAGAAQESAAESQLGADGASDWLADRCAQDQAITADLTAPTPHKAAEDRLLGSQSKGQWEQQRQDGR
jgi:hypothetical protein